MAIETAADSIAVAQGYTRRIYIEGGMEGGEFMIRPDDDLDSRFKAWAVDWQQWTRVTGCSVIIEECA